MPKEKRPLKVFLCHAHVDKDAAKSLHDRLAQDGVDAWLDEEKLFAGANWEFEIRKAVRECDIFVVCVSEQFTQRFRRKNFAQTEVGIALNEAELKPKDQIYIIPVRLENCAVPKSLQPWHWVDLFEPDGYQRLIRSLNKRIKELDETGAAKGQPGQGHISVVVSGDVSGNLIIGNQNTISTNTPDDIAVPRKAEREASEKAAREKDRKLKPKYIVAIIGAIATLLAALIGILPQFFHPVPAPTTTYTPAPTATESFTQVPTKTFTNLPPSKTPAPSLTPAQSFTPTPIPLPTEIIDSKNAAMRLVPAGEFTMGSDNGLDNEKPAHKVYLDDFYMDVYIVTNARYKACVNASVCASPVATGSNERPNYYHNPLFDNYPVIHVNWRQAKTYCEWRVARLPTEAEWEKAARGTDGRIYPWGNEGIEKTFANYANRDTTEVGIYKTGQSSYGIYDLAGNVWEWMDDWYDAYPGNVDSDSEYGQKYRVLRGGSWSSLGYGLRATVRGWANPDFKSSNIGFRCARSP